MERILIVDDNADNVKLAELLLVSEGYEVRAAEDAEQALATLRDYQPELILMDIQLPGMDGLALTRLLRQSPRLASTRIVALSAYAMRSDETNARDAGCDGYITKPIDTRAFPTLIAQFIGKVDAS